MSCKRDVIVISRYFRPFVYLFPEGWVLIPADDLAGKKRADSVSYTGQHDVLGSGSVCRAFGAHEIRHHVGDGLSKG